jgi:putative transcriptional regulator
VFTWHETSIYRKNERPVSGEQLDEVLWRANVGPVREPVTTSSNLSGSLLIAHPSLVEPTFRRTVIMLADHDAKKGSFGLVMNRPTGKLVGDLLDEKPLGHLARVPVLHGGPVEPEKMLIAAFRWHSEKRILECRHHISLEEAAALATAQLHTLRAFVGYAGWSSGQIESELAQRAWLVRKADKDEVLEVEKAPVIWREMTKTFGPWFQLVAEAPEEPGLN